MNILIKKRFRIFFKICLYLFSIIGFVLTSAFFAIKLHLTNDPGAVDRNDRFFKEIAEKNYAMPTNNLSGIDSVFKTNQHNAKIFYKISILNEFSPQNAQLLLKTYEQCKNPAIINKMLDALNIQMKDNQSYCEKIKDADVLINDKDVKYSRKNIIPWMNLPEWEMFKIACIKDKKLIDSVGNITGVEPRLITSMLVGEQIRLYNSQRENFKAIVSPLKVLTVETKFSLGVTGIKEETAIKVEKFLKDKNSPFYLGTKFENIISYKNADPSTERYNRLTNYRDHFYSYLYAALILKQIQTQWGKAGYDISQRPEILATLYNLGFEVSVPKENPQAGGSRIWLNKVMYTFGTIAFDFYYSGELIDYFPFQFQKK